MVAFTAYPLGSGSAAPRMGEPIKHPMSPTWPTAEGRRCITIELSGEHVEHLDAQADYYGCSRVAYLRRLIVDDIRRQGQTQPAA